MKKEIVISSESTTLVRDQETPVRVIVQFDRDTKVRGIRCRFYGAEKTEANYTATSTDSNGKKKTETKTATEYVEIVSQDFLLQGAERLGFFSRLSDSMATWVGGGKHEVIEAGEHEFTVNLKVPENAPASFKGNKCEVFYKLDVNVDLPIKVDWYKSQNFEVAAQLPNLDAVKPIHIVFPENSNRSFWDKTFGKDVKFEFALDRDTFSLGECGQGMLTVESREPLKIDGVRVTLVGTENSEAQGYKDTQVYRHSLHSIDTPRILTNNSVHEFDILIPKLDGPCSQAGKRFDVSWAIEVRLKIPWATDPTIVAPIWIVPKQLYADTFNKLPGTE